MQTHLPLELLCHTYNTMDSPRFWFDRALKFISLHLVKISIALLKVNQTTKTKSYSYNNCSFRGNIQCENDCVRNQFAFLLPPTYVPALSVYHMFWQKSLPLPEVSIVGFFHKHTLLFQQQHLVTGTILVPSQPSQFEIVTSTECRSLIGQRVTIQDDSCE